MQQLIQTEVQAFLDQFEDDTMQFKMPGENGPTEYVIFNEFGLLDGFPQALVAYLVAIEFLKMVVQKRNMHITDSDLLTAAAQLSTNLLGHPPIVDVLTDIQNQLADLNVNVS